MDFFFRFNLLFLIPLRSCEIIKIIHNQIKVESTVTFQGGQISFYSLLTKNFLVSARKFGGKCHAYIVCMYADSCNFGTPNSSSISEYISEYNEWLYEGDFGLV